MDWRQEAFRALIVSGLFLSLFLTAELWRNLGKPKPESTRKLVHAGGGLISLSLAYVLHSHWTVLALCFVFFLIIFWTKRHGMLQSVHGIERHSSGGIYFPIAVYVTFFFASLLRQPHFYLITVLVLSVSDALAALIGKSYGFKLYRVEQEARSLEGSFVFYISCFLIIHLGLLLLTKTGRLESVLVALLIALLATAFESISLGGADNLFIPIGVLFMLAKNTAKPVESLAWQFVLLGGVALITWLICHPAKKMGSSGLVGLILIGYAAWTMVGFNWFLPLFTAVLLMNATDLILEKPKTPEESHRIQRVFYIALVALVWILAADRAHHAARYLLVVPYLVAITAHLSILWQWKSRLNRFESDGKLPHFIQYSGTFARPLFLTALFIPVQLLFVPALNPLFTVLTGLAGTILGDRVYWVFARRHPQWDRINFLRMGLAVVLSVTLLIFLMNLIFYGIIQV